MTDETISRYCPQCNNGTALVHGARDLVGTVQGEPYFVERVRCWHCLACGSVFDLDSDDDLRVDAVIKAVAAKVRERRAQAVRATRLKLKLTQIEAGRLFGGGSTAFSEYERGKTQPHKSTMLLLSLLDRRPELLNELKDIGW